MAPLLVACSAHALLARPSSLPLMNMKTRAFSHSRYATIQLNAPELDQSCLYPRSPLVARGMLAVNALHTIAWFEYGVPAGKPVLFVHGGPGGGTGSEDARYFDPTAYRIIIVDQVSTIAISSRPLVCAHPLTIRAM